MKHLTLSQERAIIAFLAYIPPITLAEMHQMISAQHDPNANISESDQANDFLLLIVEMLSTTGFELLPTGKLKSTRGDQEHEDSINARL